MLLTSVRIHQDLQQKTQGASKIERYLSLNENGSEEKRYKNKGGN
jgi:hypothetical protein